MDVREKYAHYTGATYEAGIVDCLTIARRVYEEVYEIPIRNYARPNNWLDYPHFDFFMQLYKNEGFENPTNNVRDLREGDVLFMNVASDSVNHCAVYLGQNLILHHLLGRRSAIDSYTPQWQARVRLVARHTERESKICRQGMRVLELLPEHLRLRAALNMEKSSEK